jgi:hypothetical protein
VGVLHPTFQKSKHWLNQVLQLELFLVTWALENGKDRVIVPTGRSNIILLSGSTWLIRNEKEEKYNR